MKDGRYAEAAEQFRGIVARSPGDPFADDALLEAARLSEERLEIPSPPPSCTSAWCATTRRAAWPCAP